MPALAVPTQPNLSIGMLGMHGTVYANCAVRDCDLLWRSEPGSATAWSEMSQFARARIVHVDIDFSDSERSKPHLPITADARLFLAALNKKLARINTPTFPPGTQRSPRGKDIRSASVTSGCVLAQYAIRTERAHKIARRISPPVSASTNSGQPSSTNSPGRAHGFRVADWERWASGFRRPSARIAATAEVIDIEEIAVCR